MEQVRDVVLDNACEAIGEIRDSMAEGRKDEAGHKQTALRRMHDKGLHTYRHAKVELARVEGEEKLRVRTTKETATATAEGPSDAEADDARDEAENEAAG
jgi:hypothetical protein